MYWMFNSVAAVCYFAAIGCSVAYGDEPRQELYQAGFEPTLIDDLREPTAVQVGPDGHLYVLSIARRSLDEHSRFTRYRLDEDGRPTGQVDLLHEWKYRGDRENAGDRPIGIAFAPYATADNLVAYLTITRDPTTDPWGGKVVRAVIPPVGREASVKFEDKIVHLPVGFHELNQLVFGPDGLLYICAGSTTTSGAPAGGIAGAGGAEFPEQLLSAAVLQADMQAIEGTLDAKTADGGDYNPYAPDAPLRLYCTAIRQVYDLAWHEGRLYGSVNQNDVSGRTGSCHGVPDLQHQRPPEFLAIFQSGSTYGFPNAARGECVLMGGRPTEDSNDWYHIQDYPVGVEPPPTFDPSLMHPIGQRYAVADYDIGGGSANGILSYAGPGPHHGKLIQCFYGGQGRGRLWVFETGADGRIVHQYPLRDHLGQPLRIRDNLDLAQHPNGVLYVARYGTQSEPVDGQLWMLRPVYRHEGPQIAHTPSADAADPAEQPTARDLPQPPLVSAGASRVLTPRPDELPLKLPLNGSVRVGDSAELPRDVTLQWSVEQATGPVAFGHQDRPRTKVTFEQYGTFVLRLTADDGLRSGSALVTFTLDQPGNEPPTVRAFAERSELYVGETLEVWGEASDDGRPNPPGQLIYQWTQIGPGEGAATFEEPASLRTRVQFTNPTTYNLRLIVSDGVRTSYDQLRVTVKERLEP